MFRLASIEEATLSKLKSIGGHVKDPPNGFPLNSN